jgi:hypothetical protein
LPSGNIAVINNASTGQTYSANGLDGFKNGTGPIVYRAPSGPFDGLETGFPPFNLEFVAGGFLFETVNSGIIFDVNSGTFESGLPTCGFICSPLFALQA